MKKDTKVIRKEILDTIENLYGKADHARYIFIANNSIGEVRRQIEDALAGCNICINHIDLYVTISSIDDDVFLRI